MSKTLNRIGTAMSFLVLFAMFSAGYLVTSGKAVAWFDAGSQTTVAATKAPAKS